MAVDLGESVTRSVNLTNAGTPIDADSLPTYAITLPDGTAGTPPTVTHGVTGEYFVEYLTTVAGMHSDIWTAVIGGKTRKFGPDPFHVRPTSPAPLLGLAEARTICGLGVDVSRDERIRELLEAATELCEDHTGRSYRRQTIVETHDGGKAALLLRRSPVQSITTVVEAGLTLTAAQYVPQLSAGMLYRGTTAGATYWQSGVQNIVVTYVVGASIVSARVRQAIRVTLQHLWSTQGGASGSPRRATGTSVSSVAPNASGVTSYSLPWAAEQELAADLDGGFA